MLLVVNTKEGPLSANSWHPREMFSRERWEAKSIWIILGIPWDQISETKSGIYWKQIMILNCLFITITLLKLGAEKVPALWHVFFTWYFDWGLPGSAEPDAADRPQETDHGPAAARPSLAHGWIWQACQISVQVGLKAWLMDGYDKPVKYQSR